MDGVMEQQTGAAWVIPPFQADPSDFQESPAQEYCARQRSTIDDLEKQMAEHDREFSAALEKLKNSFMFSNPADVGAFLRSHRALVSILQEALPYLKASFGGRTPLSLEVMSEDGPPRIVYALALWPDDPAQSRAALHDFDQKWWLNNSSKAGGRIVFDYQLV
jgi:hypothetical protein